MTNKKSILVLNSRFARNIYFWIIFLAIQLLTFFREGYGPALAGPFLTVNIIVILLMAMVVYVNNLILLPLYFEKKKYSAYVFVMLIWLVVSTFILEFSYNFLFRLFPQLYTTDSGSIVSIGFFEVLIINAVFIFGFTLTKFANDYFASEDRLRSIESKQIESELNFLKAQINPHFLFNTLNSIYALSLKKSDEAPEVVLKLSDLLRYMLYECETEFIALEKEIHVTQSYLELEQIRLKNKEAISLQISGDPSGKIIAPLLWIPFVENAIKHGLNSKASDGFVRILIEINDNEIRFTCVNNFSPTIHDPERAGGIGIENTRKRLALIYPHRHTLLIKSDNQLYSVTLIIKNS
ncbi:MAG TPA: sensor histidine kinase [Bacteroidia bacterium]